MDQVHESFVSSIDTYRGSHQYTVYTTTCNVPMSDKWATGEYFEG